MITRLEMGAGQSHNGWEDRSMGVRINTADDRTTFVKHLVNLGPVTPEDEPHARLCHALWFSRIRQVSPIVE